MFYRVRRGRLGLQNNKSGWLTRTHPKSWTRNATIEPAGNDIGVSMAEGYRADAERRNPSTGLDFGHMGQLRGNTLKESQQGHESSEVHGYLGRRYSDCLLTFFWEKINFSRRPYLDIDISIPFEIQLGD